MADYNAWNETMKRRGAVEALEALLQAVERIETSYPSDYDIEGMIREHIERYNK